MEETLQHLFWSCPFAAQCWDIVCPTRQPNLSIMEAFADMKQKLHVPFHMEIIILAAWAIWITRNNFIFQNINLTINRWHDTFLQELQWLRYRVKQKHAREFCNWLDSQMP